MSILDCCPPTMLQMLFQGRLHQKKVTRKVRIIPFFRVEQQQETYNILESWTSLAKVLSTKEQDPGWQKMAWKSRRHQGHLILFIAATEQSQLATEGHHLRRDASCCWRWPKKNEEICKESSRNVLAESTFQGGCDWGIIKLLYTSRETLHACNGHRNIFSAEAKAHREPGWERYTSRYRWMFFFHISWLHYALTPFKADMKSLQKIVYHQKQHCWLVSSFHLGFPGFLPLVA